MTDKILNFEVIETWKNIDPHRWKTLVAETCHHILDTLEHLPDDCKDQRMTELLSKLDPIFSIMMERLRDYRKTL